MKLVPTKSLQPTMEVAIPVRPYGAHFSAPLLASGVTLTEELIHSIQRHNIPCVWVKGLGLRPEDMRFHDDTDVAQRSFFEKMREHSVNFVDDLKQQKSKKASAAPGLNLSGCQRSLEQLLSSLQMDPARLVLFQTLRLAREDRQNVAFQRVFLATSLGLEMESNIFEERLQKMRRVRRHLDLKDYLAAKDLRALGMAAMLYGMEDMVADDNPQLLVRLNHEIDTMKDAVLKTLLKQRFQLNNGQGYPREKRDDEGRARGLEDSELHLFSRILHVVDSYTRRMSENDSPLLSLFGVLEEEGHQHDPVILDLLLRTLSPFPVGTRVVLSDGREAVVRKFNPLHPCRPLVVLSDNGSDINLAEVPFHRLSVKKSDMSPGVGHCDKFVYTNFNHAE